MPPHHLLLLLCLWPASSRCDSFLVKGPAILAQEEGLKAAADGRYSEAVEKRSADIGITCAVLRNPNMEFRGAADSSASCSGV